MALDFKRRHFQPEVILMLVRWCQLAPNFVQSISAIFTNPLALFLPFH